MNSLLEAEQVDSHDSHNFDSLTAQEMKIFMKDHFSKCDQIYKKLRIWSHLLKKSLMEKFIFCAVSPVFHN